jgi:hypothetical protein
MYCAHNTLKQGVNMTPIGPTMEEAHVGAPKQNYERVQIVEDDTSRTNASDQASNRGIYSDPSDESRQLVAMAEDEDISTDPSSEASVNLTFGSVSISSAVNSTQIDQLGNTLSQLCECYQGEFKRHLVTWQRSPEERWFSACFVCPFSGESFLSGLLLEADGYMNGLDGLNWYSDKHQAETAAASRYIDCFRFRGQASSNVPDRHRFRHESPPDTLDFSASILPAAARSHIEQLQREAMASCTRNTGISVVSPLSDPTGMQTITGTMSPDQASPAPRVTGTMVIRAPEEDRDPKQKLHQRYRKGMINRIEIGQVEIPAENFVIYTNPNRNELGPLYTCFFVCPLFGECFLSDELERSGTKVSTRNGLKWHKTIRAAKKTAAARAFDCFEYREGCPTRHRSCVKVPCERDMALPSRPTIDLNTHRHLRCLQAEAKERGRRYSQQRSLT